MNVPKDKPKRPSKVTKRRGRNAEQESYLQRTFGDLPVVDATDDLRVPITASALGRSKRKDPEHCMFAEACRDVLKSSAAVFFKTTAYVDVVGKDGVRRVERFTLTPEMRDLIERFDRGLKVKADDAWLVLKAPTLGRSLEYTRKKNKALRRAKRLGTYVAKGPERAGQKATRSKPRDLEVRQGTGQWQMIKREKAAA
jgi:hypothetical protein